MKKVMAIRAVIVFIFLLSGCGDNPFDPDGWKTRSYQGFNLRWRVQGSDLEVELTGPSTGWVAVGFGGSYLMHDSNIIIGAVSGSGVSIRDDFGIDSNTHVSDSSLQGGQQNVYDKSGSESSGSTTISFSTPLDSGDLYDNVLWEGQNCTVLLMCGADGNDNLDSDYATIANTTITI